MSGHISPLSKGVTRTRVVYQNRYGMDIVGELYRAGTLDLEERHPALVVGAPYGGVKEQGPCVYGDELARRGFVVLTFDQSFMGEFRRLPPACLLSGYLCGELQRCGGLSGIAALCGPGADRRHRHLRLRRLCPLGRPVRYPDSGGGHNEHVRYECGGPAGDGRRGRSGRQGAAVPAALGGRGAGLSGVYPLLPGAAPGRRCRPGWGSRTPSGSASTPSGGATIPMPGAGLPPPAAWP